MNHSNIQGGKEAIYRKIVISVVYLVIFLLCGLGFKMIDHDNWWGIILQLPASRIMLYGLSKLL